MSCSAGPSEASWGQLETLTRDEVLPPISRVTLKFLQKQSYKIINSDD